MYCVLFYARCAAFYVFLLLLVVFVVAAAALVVVVIIALICFCPFAAGDLPPPSALPFFAARQLRCARRLFGASQVALTQKQQQ